MKLPNEEGGNDITLLENVAGEMRRLLAEYNAQPAKTFADVVAFHMALDCLILFKECLKHNIVPFIIEDDLKLFYYRGLKEWTTKKAPLRTPA